MNGIGVSPGIAIGRACVIKNNTVALTGILLEDEEAVEREIKKFTEAVNVSIEEVKTIIANAELTLRGEGVEILEAHIELLSDPQIESDVVKKIRGDRKTANDALIEVTHNIVQLFKNMNDEYLSTRAADVQDIGNRISKNLHTSFKPRLQKFSADTIIIAEDLSPSDTITMDINHVIGFATQMGGKTSHAAIIAKSRGIPAVVGCWDDLNDVKDNDVILLDGETGRLIVRPSKEELDLYTAKRDDFVQKAGTRCTRCTPLS